MSEYLNFERLFFGNILVSHTARHRNNIVVALELQNLASTDEADSVVTDLNAIGTHPFMISVLQNSGQVKEYAVAPSAQEPLINNQGSTTGRSGQGKVDVWVFVVVIIGIIVLGVAAAAFYRRRVEDNMRQEVRGILQEYMPLEEMDNAGGQSS